MHLKEIIQNNEDRLNLKNKEDQELLSISNHNIDIIKSQKKNDLKYKIIESK